MMKMRSLVIFVSVAFILVSAACTGLRHGEQPVEHAVKEMSLLERIPENVGVLVKFEAPEMLYQHMAVSENSILGKSLKQSNIEKMRNWLGFNPLDLQELRQAGFDPEKSFGVAVFNIRINPDEKPETEFDALALLPVTDGAAAMDTIRKGLEKENPLFTEAEKDGVYYLKWNHSETGAECCAAVQDQYLYLTMNSKPDPQAFLESVIRDKSSVTRTETFREIAPHTDFNRGLAFYFNIAGLVEANSGRIEKAATARSASADEAELVNESLKECFAATITTDLASPDFSLKTVLSLMPDSDIKKLWEPHLVNRQKILGIKEPAVLLISFGTDIMEYYKTITDKISGERSGSLKTRMDEFEQKTGIDPEKEVLGNLSGSMNLAMYDGASINLMNYNALFTAGIRDEQVMRNVIDKAIQTLPPNKEGMISRGKICGKDAYIVNGPMTKIYAGIDDNTFVVASGKPLFEKALNADKNKGFAANLIDEQLKESLMGKRNIFYLNIDESVKAVNSFAMFFREPAGGEQKFKDKLDAVSGFKYVLASSGLEQDMIKSELKVETRFTRPFFVEVAEIAYDADWEKP